MPEAPVKSPQQRPKLKIRKGKKVTDGVEVQTIFADIKSGKLKPSHEFSTDGENWRRLDQHPQLAKLFSQVAKTPSAKKSGKGSLLFLLLILLVAGAGLYFYPYLAFYNVQTASEFNDKMKLELWVDKSALARSVTKQVNAQWADISSKKITGSPNAKTVLPKARARVDELIAGLISSEAVMALSLGKSDFSSYINKTDKGASTSPGKDPLSEVSYDLDYAQKAISRIETVLGRADLYYRDLETFIAAVKGTNGESIEFQYGRNGMDWKVVEVNLPVGPLHNSIEAIVDSELEKAKRASRSKKKKKAETQKTRPQVAKETSAKKQYLSKYLVVKNLTVGKGKKYKFGSPNPGFFATLVNMGTQTLNEVEVTVYFFNGKGAIASQKKLYPVSVSKYRPGRDNDPMKPKSTKKIGYLVKDFAPKSWSGKISLKVTNIILKGT